MDTIILYDNPQFISEGIARITEPRFHLGELKGRFFPIRSLPNPIPRRPVAPQEPGQIARHRL